MLKLIIEKLDLEERTAHHEIEKELKVGTIQKFLFLDRQILYGLSSWDPVNIDLNLLLEIWNTHNRSQEANAAELNAWAKLIEATRGL